MVTTLEMSKEYDKLHSKRVKMVTTLESSVYLESNAYSTEIDVWAVGCMLYEMVHLKLTVVFTFSGRY